MSENMLGVTVHDAQGVVADLLQKLGGENGEEWLKATKRFLRKEYPWATVEDAIYTVAVDYAKPISHILDEGNYNWAHVYITDDNFPALFKYHNDRWCQASHVEDVEMHLVHPGHARTREEAWKEVEARGLRSANIEELLAFGANYPNLQKQFPIVAIGALWQRSDSRDPLVPALGCIGNNRQVYLMPTSYAWDPSYRVLAVRK